MMKQVPDYNIICLAENFPTKPPAGFPGETYDAPARRPRTTLATTAALLAILEIAHDKNHCLPRVETQLNGETPRDGTAFASSNPDVQLDKRDSN
jgi:hypothetical protein